MLNNFWMWVCQSVADHYFYKGLHLGWDTIEGNKLLNKYHDWIDIKFIFKKDE